MFSSDLIAVVIPILVLIFIVGVFVVLAVFFAKLITTLFQQGKSIGQKKTTAQVTVNSKYVTYTNAGDDHYAGETYPTYYINVTTSLDEILVFEVSAKLYGQLIVASSGLIKYKGTWLKSFTH